MSVDPKRVESFFTDLFNIPVIASRAIKAERNGASPDVALSNSLHSLGYSSPDTHPTPDYYYDVMSGNIPYSSAKSVSNSDSSPSGDLFSSPAATSALSYFNAPYAQEYGMDASTAYQEALAGSAHQREVADLRAAGLNPVLSAGAGSGAQSFGGTAFVPFGSSSSAKSVSSALRDSGVFQIVKGVVGLVKPSSATAVGNLVEGLSRLIE